MPIPHVDRIPQTLTIPILHSFVIVILDSLVPVRHICDNLVPIFRMFGELVPVLHTLEFYTDFFTCDDLIPFFTDVRI